MPRAGSENRRHARLDLKLLEQPVEMHLDRLLPDPEHGGELLVAVRMRAPDPVKEAFGQRSEGIHVE